MDASQKYKRLFWIIFITWFITASVNALLGRDDGTDINVGTMLPVEPIKKQQQTSSVEAGRAGSSVGSAEGSVRRAEEAIKRSQESTSKVAEGIDRCALLIEECRRIAKENERIFYSAGNELNGGKAESKP